MKVAIDARSLSERYTSNRTYWFELIRELIPLAAHEKVELLLISDRPIDTSAFPVVGTVRVIIAPALNSRLWSLFTFPKVCKREGADLAHVQYTVSPYLKVPAVTTIHDISFFIEPAWFGFKDRTLLRLSVPASIKRAKKVIAVSETSRKEMIDILGVSPGKIIATPLGVPSFCQPHSPTSPPSPPHAPTLSPSHPLTPSLTSSPPSVLFVGGLQARKNWKTAIAAVAGARREWPELELTITGPSRVDQQALAATIEQFQAAAWLHRPGGVPQEQLAELYKTAFCAIHPSLHEGFGLTPLEGFACGVPVIASNRGAIPEVAGDAAVLLDPENPEAWTDAILSLRDPQLRAELVVKGRKRAAEFTWAKTATRTLQAYKAACT